MEGIYTNAPWCDDALKAVSACTRLAKCHTALKVAELREYVEFSAKTHLETIVRRSDYVHASEEWSTAVKQYYIVKCTLCFLCFYLYVAYNVCGVFWQSSSVVGEQCGGGVRQYYSVSVHCFSPLAN